MKTVPLFDENDLLQQIASGDERAFTLLFQQYSAKVYSFALKLTKDDELAEEVVQEIFLRLWLNRDTLGNIKEFGAYLNRINRNYCLNVIRQLARQNNTANQYGSQITEYSYDTEQQIDFHGTQQLVDAAIEKLTPQQQKVYRLCHVEGLKYEEVAAELGISAGTVHTHMKQALKMIRSHLDHAGAAAFICSLMVHLKK